MGQTFHHQEPSFMLINYTTLILIMVITVNLCFANLDERMRRFGLRPRLWEKWMGKVSERWAGGERASIIFNIIIIILPSHQCSLLVFIIIIRVSERCTGCVRSPLPASSWFMIRIIWILIHYGLPQNCWHLHHQKEGQVVKELCSPHHLSCHPYQCQYHLSIIFSRHHRHHHLNHYHYPARRCPCPSPVRGGLCQQAELREEGGEQAIWGGGASTWAELFAF